MPRRYVRPVDSRYLITQEGSLREPSWRMDRSATSAQVLPDGCRDLVVRCDEEGRLSVFVSRLDDGPRLARAGTARSLMGWRLEPGAEVCSAALRQASSKLQAPADLACLLDQIVALRPSTTEALALVGRNIPVADAAATLGVSTRTLHRFLVGRTGRPPSWWRSLARVRRAARRVHTEDLAEVALTEGFSDQAHMTREFRRWLGCTPGKPSANAQRAVWSMGYDPTGVPSSIRKPSGERT